MHNKMQQINLCTQYKSFESDLIGTYHNGTSQVMKNSANCKSCIHNSSRNCKQSFQTLDSDGHHFFC